MKRIFLILLFVFYTIFVPFVFANCMGEDLPYVRSDSSDEDENEDSVDCEANEFLVADCVDDATADESADEDSSSDDTPDDSSADEEDAGGDTTDDTDDTATEE